MSPAPFIWNIGSLYEFLTISEWCGLSMVNQELYGFIKESFVSPLIQQKIKREILAHTQTLLNIWTQPYLLETVENIISSSSSSSSSQSFRKKRSDPQKQNDQNDHIDLFINFFSYNNIGRDIYRVCIMFLKQIMHSPTRIFHIWNLDHLTISSCQQIHHLFQNMTNVTDFLCTVWEHTEELLICHKSWQRTSIIFNFLLYDSLHLPT